LLRLHNEAEMLLYTHPVTDARAAQRLPAVNAIWLHGAGVLPAADAPAIAQRARRLRVDTRLAQAADEGGQPAWQTAWQTVQPELVAQLTAMRGQADARLTLCGDEAAWPLAPASGGLGQRVARLVKPLRLADLLGSLVPQAEAGTAGAEPGARHAL
jgi:hypothetical protein